MAAGSKIQDEKQEYQYSYPFITPSGHEFSFYDTPDNQRLVVKHSSGSHIEFKADGSVFIKAVGDLHQHSSVLSSQSAAAAGADNTTLRYDADLTIEVAGRLRFKCAEYDMEAGKTAYQKAGTDFITSGNNVTTKATESISLEGTKSIYMDTKEMRERVVSRQTEAGTQEDSGTGGVNIMKVHGNTIIQNDDVNGGITIASAGYLNLVSGKERIDVVGKFTTSPSTQGRATFTQRVFAPQPAGALDVSGQPGDYYFESSAGSYYRYGSQVGASTQNPSCGLTQLIQTGDMLQRVEVGDRTRWVTGNETVSITGNQTVVAQMIFLN